MLLCDMVDVPIELVVIMSMRALMVDRLRLSNINIVASQLVKLLVMVIIVNLYTITRMNITEYVPYQEIRGKS